MAIGRSAALPVNKQKFSQTTRNPPHNSQESRAGTQNPNSLMHGLSPFSCGASPRKCGAWYLWNAVGIASIDLCPDKEAVHHLHLHEVRVSPFGANHNVR